MYFLTTEIVDNLATLVASEEVATFEVENIQDPLGSKRWRSTGLTPYIYGQFESAKTITAWGSWYTNARSGDQARLRLADTQANLTAAPALDTGKVDIWPAGSDLSSWFATGQPGYVHQRATIGSPVSASWFRIDYDYTGNADGYVEVGALFLDARFTPGRGHLWGWTYHPVSRSGYEVAYAAGGLGRGGGTFKRGASFSFPAMSTADMLGTFDVLLRERRDVKPVGVVLLEDEATYPMSYMFYGYPTVRDISNPYVGFQLEVTITEP